MKFPAGDDDETDGLGCLPAGVQAGSRSADPFGGLVATYQTLAFEIDTQASYKINTGANNFEFGDVPGLTLLFSIAFGRAVCKAGFPVFSMASLK